MVAGMDGIWTTSKKKVKPTNTFDTAALCACIVVFQRAKECGRCKQGLIYPTSERCEKQTAESWSRGWSWQQSRQILNVQKVSENEKNNTLMVMLGCLWVGIHVEFDVLWVWATSAGFPLTTCIYPVVGSSSLLWCGFDPNEDCYFYETFKRVFILQLLSAVQQFSFTALEFIRHCHLRMTEKAFWVGVT